MRRPRARLLSCALAACVVLVPAMGASPASAAPAAACAEPHAAAVARHALRGTLKKETSAFASAEQDAQQQLATARTRQAAVRADPTSTSADEGRAAADVAHPTRLLRLVAAARAGLAADRAKVGRCGSAVMRRLTLRANHREVDYAIGALTSFRTTARTYRKWDTASRDAFPVGSQEYRTWTKRIKADDMLEGVADAAIRTMRQKRL